MFFVRAIVEWMYEIHVWNKYIICTSYTTNQCKMQITGYDEIFTKYMAGNGVTCLIYLKVLKNKKRVTIRYQF